jgi:hypothetical protein
MKTSQGTQFAEPCVVRSLFPNTCMALNLSAGEKSDLVQYLLSLTFGGSN